MIPQLVCSKISFILNSFQFPVVTQYDNKIEKLDETYQLNILIKPSATTTAQVPPTRRWRHTPLQVCDSLDSLALPCASVFLCITLPYLCNSESALPCITLHCLALHIIVLPCIVLPSLAYVARYQPSCFLIFQPASLSLLLTAGKLDSSAYI